MAKPTKPAAKDISAMKALRDELALEAEIANLRADVIAANIRRMKTSAEYAELRAKKN